MQSQGEPIMTSLAVSRTETKILNLLNKLDELRDYHDISLAQGDCRGAGLWLRRIQDLAKEIDNVIVTKEPATIDF